MGAREKSKPVGVRIKGRLPNVERESFWRRWGGTLDERVRKPVFTSAQTTR